MTTALPELLTVEEVATHLRVSRATIDRWVAGGEFPAPFKFGGAILRFSRDAVLAYVAASQTNAPMPARTRTASRKPAKSSKKRRAAK